MNKRVIRLSLIVAILFVAAVGIFVFIHQALGAGTSTTTAPISNQQAALDRTLAGLHVRGVEVPSTWSVSSMQQAPNPAQLPPQPPNPGNVQSVWCSVISPAVIIDAKGQNPSYSLTHFVIVESNANWLAYTVDGLQANQGKTVFTALGCTNG